ncbi:hypothetical protein DID88_004606 [Monilinia fructigena]|uniref:Uncharacterized protein n=1 Tax=Monilinia fructigena TaxID=38457 RepID=A0A395ISC8_9HELO|nr:hypothetical protein DID88_004606 [Monilinia fructigena]
MPAYNSIFNTDSPTTLHLIGNFPLLPSAQSRRWGEGGTEGGTENIALDSNFAVPGDPGFPLNQMFEAPASRQEAETLRQYLGQVRQELASRLLARIYDTEDGKPSKCG